MSRRTMKNHILSALIALSITTTVPLAWAQDQYWTGPSTAVPASDPMLGDDRFGSPGVIMPGFDSQPAVATTPVTQPGGNPFVRVAVATPGAATVGPAPIWVPGSVVAPVQPFTLSSLDPAAPDAGLVPSPTPSVDESALRYYAGERDLPRVGAEIRRLKALYPGWEPPADLFQPQNVIDEQPLWDLYAAGQYAAIHARLAQLQEANPSWAPSADLTTKLADAEARQAMRLAFQSSQWQQVVNVAATHNSMLVCPEMEALWQLGEAFAHLRDFASSFDLYKYILLNCDKPEDRLATMQKAALLLPQQGISSLVLLGRQLPDGSNEFASIGFDPLRKRIAATSGAGFGFGSDPISFGELESFANYVRATRDPGDISMIAWYYYGQQQWPAAYAWFTAGSRISRDPKFIEGLVLSLRNAGQIEGALKIATVTRERSPELEKEYVEIVASILSDPDSDIKFTKQDLSTFEKVVEHGEWALGAQALGWFQLYDDELKLASAWFDKSMEWEVTEGGVIGQAVIASRNKRYNTLASLKAKYMDDYPGLDDFTVYKTRAPAAKSSTKAKAKTTDNCGGLTGIIRQMFCNT